MKDLKERLTVPELLPKAEKLIEMFKDDLPKEKQKSFVNQVVAKLNGAYRLAKHEIKPSSTSE